MKVIQSVVFLSLACLAIGEEPGSHDWLPEGATHRLGLPNFRTVTHLRSISWTPDGKILVGVCRAYGTATFWDPETGVVRRTMSSVRGPISFSPDGKELVVASMVPDVRNCEDFRVVRRFPSLGNEYVDVTDLAWSPDGKIIAACDLHDLLILRDAKTLKEIARIELAEAAIGELSWSADSSRIAYRAEGSATVLEVATKKVLASVPKSDDFDSWITLSPDGNTLVRGNNNDKPCLVWDVQAGARLEVLQKALGNAMRLAFSPDSRLIASTGLEITRVLEVATGKVVLDGGAGSGGLYLVFSPDGKRLAVQAGAGVRVWNLTSGKEVAPDLAGTVSVDRLAWTPDGNSLLAQGRGESVVLWDARAGTSRVLPGATWFFCLSDDGRLLAEYVDENKLRVRELATGRSVFETEYSPGCFGQVWFLRGSHRVAFPAESVPRRENAIDVRDCDTGKTVGTLRGATDRAGFGLASSATRALTISGRQLGIWDLADFHLIHKMNAPDLTTFVGADLTEDGTLLLVALRKSDEKATLELRQADTGATVWSEHYPSASRTLMEEPLLKFSPDGRFFLLLCEGKDASDDYSVRLYEVITGREVRRFDSQDCYVRSFAFSRDGKRIALGLQNGLVLLFPLQPQDLPPAPEFPALIEELASDKPSDAWRAAWNIVQSHADDTPVLYESLARPPDGTAVADRATRRVVRGVAALEWIASAEAKSALERLAKEHYSATGRAEAAAALKRLEALR